jgi:AcrR family transcriptional regulator
VTAERLRGAILEIQGEVPSMTTLAEHLGVGVTTLYSHVRGQEELRRLAGDIVFDAWPPPEPEPGEHWAAWAHRWAREALVMAHRHPVVSAARPLAGGQLRYFERVMAKLVGFGFPPDEALFTFYSVVLLVLGVGTQLAATREEESRASRSVWELFLDARADQADSLPILEGMIEDALPGQDQVFDDLVWFTLSGIARRRGEVLPARP